MRSFYLNELIPKFLRPTMLDKIIRKLSPLFVCKSLKMFKEVLSYSKPIQTNVNDTSLFNGHDSLFKSLVPLCKVYGEYGCGRSTIWASQNSNAFLLCVDSSHEWLETIRESLANQSRAAMHWADLGDIGEWGRPVSYAKRLNFSDYTEWIWQQTHKPDLVLIDGRFRVCCFLTSLKFARPGSLILFDDYVDRPHYHFIETYLRPAQLYGRQALFEIPDFSLHEISSIEKDIQNFKYVFD